MKTPINPREIGLASVFFAEKIRKALSGESGEKHLDKNGEDITVEILLVAFIESLVAHQVLKRAPEPSTEH